MLALEDKMIATSAPAGPALEGGNISCGVASVTGAISKVRVIGERTIIERLETHRQRESVEPAC